MLRALRPAQDGISSAAATGAVPAGFRISKVHLGVEGLGNWTRLGVLCWDA